MALPKTASVPIWQPFAKGKWPAGLPRSASVLMGAGLETPNRDDELVMNTLW